MDIYIDLKKKVSVSGTSHIHASDVCSIQAPSDLKQRAENICILPTGLSNKKLFLVTAIDVITAINQDLPGHTINSVGEKETLVEYHRTKKKDNPTLKYLKIIILSLVFAVGACTAIMSFHNDSEIPKVFKAYNKLFTGEEKDDPRLLQVPYAIGLALGIIIFFNHIGGKKLTDDPSPIEIEMSDYDKTVTDTLIDFLTVKKNLNQSSPKGGPPHDIP